MEEQIGDQPDLSKPLSRWSAPHWAKRHGIAAALKSDARWAVLEALFMFLPCVRPGRETIERMTGLSASSVKRSLRALRRVGLIDYPDNWGGSGHSNLYAIADIRKREMVDAILKRVHNEPDHKEPVRANEPVHSDPVKGFIMTQKGAIMTPEVRNRSSQEKSFRAEAALGPQAPLRDRSDKAEQDHRLTEEYGGAYRGGKDIESAIRDGATLEQVERMAIENYLVFGSQEWPEVGDLPLNRLASAVVEEFDLVQFVCAQAGVTVTLTKHSMSDESIVAAARKILNLEYEDEIAGLRREMKLARRAA